MSSFTKPLRVEITQREVKGRCLAVLIDGFEYHVGHLNSTDVIRVPAGFVTDFASIPHVARMFVPVLGRAAKAAVIHDYLVVENERSWEESAKIFREGMMVLGVDWFQRILMYYSVKYYGPIRKILVRE
jgi:hypothetical protein